MAFECAGNIGQSRPHSSAHPTNLSEFKSTEIMQCVFSEQSGIKLDLDKRKIIGKSSKFDNRTRTCFSMTKFYGKLENVLN